MPLIRIDPHTGPLGPRSQPRLFVRGGSRAVSVVAAVLSGMLGSIGLGGCGQDDVSGTAAPPKPVTVATLRTGIPRSETLVAGVVEPYRRSDTSFDVSGLVTEVIDLGESADGPQLDGAGSLLLDPDGKPVREGTVLAVLDPTRFQQAVTAAELSLASTDRQIDAMEIELDTVFPARIESAMAAVSAASADVASARESVSAAEAELELARTTVERDRVLIQSGAVAQSVLDQSESSFRTATAGLAQARSALDAALQSEQSAIASQAETEGDLSVRRADLESLRASRAELVNALEQAQTDLDSSVLRAPFQGRVTSRYVERGSFANAGTAIVELTMETAVKVVITVSAEEERDISLGMRMPIYASGAGNGSEPAAFSGTVFEKASVADSGTRTFRIGLILPNPLLNTAGEGVSGDAASISDLFPVIRLPGTPDDHLYVNVACLLEYDGETVVLALPDDIDQAAATGSLQVPAVVPVTLTDDWEQLDTWSLRRVEPSVELRAGDTLILHPGEADRAGVVVGSQQFAFRPGDVVRVGLAASLPEPGFWVPATAIVPRTGESLLYLAREGEAREVAVDVLESSGGFRRVASPEIGDGDAIVVRGMQYLSDGDAVISQPAASEGDR
ncbi:MAG: HlyD family efflux transporter periplasmic adaptor subunit [Planctomycetota bacterium]